MANERFIRGKVDSAHHAGQHSHRMRLDAKPLDLDAYYLSEQDPQRDDLRELQAKSIHDEEVDFMREKMLPVENPVWEERK